MESEALALVAHRGGGCLILADTQDEAGPRSVHMKVLLCIVGRWSRWTSEDPFQLKRYYELFRQEGI